MPELRAIEDHSLNAPSGARCFLTVNTRTAGGILLSLNAPSGARCFLTKTFDGYKFIPAICLNAPSGARCFLTLPLDLFETFSTNGLNAPSGARCFLTPQRESLGRIHN